MLLCCRQSGVNNTQAHVYTLLIGSDDDAIEIIVLLAPFTSKASSFCNPHSTHDVYCMSGYCAVEGSDTVALH